MLYISIVDDDPIALTRLQAELEIQLKQQKIDIVIKTFTSGITFLKERPYTDILFLDVEMPGMNGINVAKEIRKDNHNVIIFFCTIYHQFAINGYEVNALGYMVKPIDSYSLSVNLKHALTYLEEHRRSQEKKLELHAYQSIIIVPLSDLLYVEVKKHSLFYHLKEESEYPEKIIKIRGTMSNLYDSLKNDNFEKCGNSFLVNLEYVYSIKGESVILNNSISLPLSRIYKDVFMKRFTTFLVKKGSIVL